jgi:hypothetical protein
MFSRAAIAAALICIPATVFAAGAIAVDDEAGQNPSDVGYGYATGHSSRDEAGAAALRNCRREGNRSCKVAVRFDECGAYAASRRNYGIGWGSSERVARQNALSQCDDNCRIVFAICE